MMLGNFHKIMYLVSGRPKFESRFDSKVCVFLITIYSISHGNGPSASLGNCFFFFPVTQGKD